MCVFSGDGMVLVMDLLDHSAGRGSLVATLI